MEKGKFALLYMSTLALVAGILYVFSQSTDTAPYIDLGISAAALFSIISIVVYVVNEKLTDTNRKVLFIQIILMNMILKMVISAVIVFIYYTNNSPEDGAFILPFLAVYVLFTVFETYFMNEQSRAK